MIDLEVYFQTFTSGMYMISYLNMVGAACKRGCFLKASGAGIRFGNFMKNVRNLIYKNLTYNSRMAIIEKNTEIGGTRPAVSREGELPRATKRRQ